MKISYRNSAIIKNIETKKFDFHVFPKDHALMDSINIDSEWRLFCDLNPPIYRLTENFIDAAEKASDKLSKVVRDSKEVICGTSVILAKIPGGSLLSYCINYELCAGNIIDLTFFTFTDMAFRSVIKYHMSPEGTIVKDLQYIHTGFTHNDELLLSEKIRFITQVDIFIKYAQIETVFLKSKERIRDVSCKYINETSSNVTILDSKWFTNLVKSDAFKVRGHFRLQPCGEDMKNRKLIWISDFEKSGYTAPARKLAQE